MPKPRVTGERKEQTLKSRIAGVAQTYRLIATTDAAPATSASSNTLLLLIYFDYEYVLLTYSADCARGAPRVISRVQSADVNDDGVANTLTSTRLQASSVGCCGQTGFTPMRTINNDCSVNAIDLNYGRATSANPFPRSPGSHRAHRSPSTR